MPLFGNKLELLSKAHGLSSVIHQEIPYLQNPKERESDPMRQLQQHYILLISGIKDRLQNSDRQNQEG